MTEEQIKALESVLPARKQDQAPPADAMIDDFQLENVDNSRERARAHGATMDDEDDDVPPGAERVQCASQ